MTRWKVVDNKVYIENVAGEWGRTVAVCEYKKDAAQIVRDHHRAEAFEAMREALIESDIWLRGSQANQGHCKTLYDVLAKTKAALALAEAAQPKEGD